MRKFLILALVIFIELPLATAQLSKSRPSQLVAAADGLWKLRRYEISAGLGTTQLFGDIGGFSKGKNILGFKDFSFKQTRFNFSPCIRYRITDVISARLNFAIGGFHSNDVRGSNMDRRFESSTFFFEPSLIGEYYFIKSKSESSYMFQKGKSTESVPLLSAINLYCFTGLGGISYKVKPNEVLVVHTVKTKGFAAVIPVGVGVNVPWTRLINLGLEISGRYAFSDYLDGYTSVYSKSNDIYYFVNLTFAYKIKTGPSGLPAFR